jgi:hypothetical protein
MIKRLLGIRSLAHRGSQATFLLILLLGTNAPAFGEAISADVKARLLNDYLICITERERLLPSGRGEPVNLADLQASCESIAAAVERTVDAEGKDPVLAQLAGLRQGLAKKRALQEHPPTTQDGQISR